MGLIPVMLLKRPTVAMAEGLLTAVKLLLSRRCKTAAVDASHSRGHLGRPLARRLFPFSSGSTTVDMGTD
jgi:hypothetical protein